MKRLLRFIIRSLFLVLIALFSALATMRLAIHGREVRVPDVQGMTTLQAQETANSSGLFISIEDRFYSTEVPAGRIISQVPSAKTEVRRGWRVRVAESLGPQRIAIPDLVGQTELAATLNLRQRGLDLATVAAVPVTDSVPDRVLAQLPPAGAANAVSPKVNLLLAQAPPPAEFVMPNFVGRSLPEVKDKIEKAGLRLVSVEASALNENPAVFSIAGANTSSSSRSSSISISGRISSQSPPAGSRVNAQTEIRLQVTQ